MPGKGRSYSDPSYGEKKVFSFNRCSMGTRSDGALVSQAGIFTALEPIIVKKWNITCDATGDGGTSVWVLCKGTTALGTLAFVTNPTAGTTKSGSLTPTALSAGDTLRLYSGTSVADPAPFVIARVEYREAFEADDN